jgi:hypothetical protein
MDLALRISLCVVCGLIIGLHADGRFNTPLRNRSTTRRHLYQQARFAYICVTVIVFIILVMVLNVWPFADQKSAEPFILQLLTALVLLTDGIPHLPFLNEIDRKVLEFFKRIANIPKEVQRCADQLKPELLRIQADDLSILKTFIEDEVALPRELQSHLRIDQRDQIDNSEYQFTRLLKLYRGVIELTSSSKYERFFSDYADEWNQAQEDLHNFCLRSATSLELAVKYRADNSAPVHRELLEDIRENFRLRCRERFSQLTLLLAGALLSSVPDEEQVAAGLREAGFVVNYEKSVEFPLDELSKMAVVLFVSVFAIHACIPFLLEHIGTGAVRETPTLPARLMWPTLTVLSYVTAIAITLKLLVVHPRALARPIRPWGKYIVCAALAGLSVAALSCIFVIIRYLTTNHVYWMFIPRMSIAVAAMCFVVAVLCETELRNGNESSLQHLVEGTMVAVTMLLTEVMLDLYLGSLLPTHETLLGARTFTFTIIIPCFLAGIVGFWVPHMFRMSRLFARSSKVGQQVPARKRGRLRRLRIVGGTAASKAAIEGNAKFA